MPTLAVHSPARRVQSERSPLLGASGASYATSTSDSGGAKTKNVGQPAGLEDGALPLWFSWTVGVSVAVSLAWLLLFVVVGSHPATQAPWRPSEATSPPSTAATSPSTATTDSAEGAFYLYTGVFNSLVGSFLSASGYCCQKVAHNRVQRCPELGAASQQRVFLAGLLVLAVGTISAVANLGILGQAVQAPFAALTLIYSALLGRFVLGEPLVAVDLLSSVLIIAGVAGDVAAAQFADLPPPRTFDLQSLARLVFRDSVMPTAYTIIALAYTTAILRRVHTRKLHRGAIGLLAFSSCAGIMAGFTSLATKSAVVVASSAFSSHSGDVQRHHSIHRALMTLVNPFYVLILLAIPAALVPQLYFLNRGLEHFGTLKFVPLYQAFIILGNTACGMVFYNEMAGYGAAPLACFAAGIAVTLSGVCLLLAKVDRDNANGLVLPVSAASASSQAVPAFPTEFSFDDMQFATENVTPIHDFDECKRAIVKLLRSATSSIYYSTFLCDFNQELEDAGDTYTRDKEPTTIASLLKAAVKRGVNVHVLYNPATDYGTTTTDELRRIFPAQDNADAGAGEGRIRLAFAESDLGPSFFTTWISNNSKYGFHHQKYLCVDGDTIMVTGCDVNAERAGWLHVNGIGYYWHELGVVAPCSPAMFQWIQRNHEPSTPRHDALSEREDDKRSPPFPLVAGGWREENAMVNLILNARESVQLENQILISGGGLQHNRVCAALVARIARAHHNREPFRALVLTNAAQQDEPSHVTRLYCALSIQWSLEQLEACASFAHGLSKHDLARYLLVGRLESRNRATNDGILIKVHSNIVIVDGCYALRSSSNLSDRSLSARPTDTELGLLFAGPCVSVFQQQLLNMYMGTTGETYTVSTVVDRVRSHGGVPDTGRSRRDGCCIVPLAKRAPWSPVLTWFLMNAFIYCSEGATGGRYKVSYTTTALEHDGDDGNAKRKIASDTTASADEISVAVAC